MCAELAEEGRAGKGDCFDVASRASGWQIGDKASSWLGADGSKQSDFVLDGEHSGGRHRPDRGTSWAGL